MNFSALELKTLNVALDEVAKSVARLDSVIRSLVLFLAVNAVLFTLNAYVFYFGVESLGLPELHLMPFVLSQSIIVISSLYIALTLEKIKARKRVLKEALSRGISQLEKLFNTLHKQD